MHQTKLFAGSALLLLLPFVTSAQGAGGGFAGGDASGGPMGPMLTAILQFTDSVLIPLVIGIGFFMFAWGIFLYFIAGGASDEKKEKGKSLMIYAILGFLLIFMFWGIVNLLVDSFGLGGQDVNDIVPKLPTGGA